MNRPRFSVADTTTATLTRPISYRAYQEGDETALMQGFNKAFALTRTVEYWRWKFLHNGRTRVWLATDATGQILSQMAAHPASWQLRGKPLAAAQSGDVFAVRNPEVIRNRVMLKTFAAFHRQQKEQGEIQFLFGFPNLTLSGLHDTSSPLQRGDRPVARLSFCLSGTGIRHQALPGILQKPPSPLAADTLWYRCSHRYAVSCKRNWSWLSWRFLRRPDVSDYEFLSVYDARGHLCGWAVTRPVDNTLIICDLLWDGLALAEFGRLLSAIEHKASMAGLERISCWLEGDSQARTLLLQSGWEDSSAQQTVSLYMHPYDTTLDYDWIRSNLYLTHADSDLI